MQIGIKTSAMVSKSVDRLRTPAGPRFRTWVQATVALTSLWRRGSCTVRILEPSASKWVANERRKVAPDMPVAVGPKGLAELLQELGLCARQGPRDHPPGPLSRCDALAALEAPPDAQCLPAWNETYVTPEHTQRIRSLQVKSDTPITSTAMAGV